jgi:hypothetical protein
MLRLLGLILFVWPLISVTAAEPPCFDEQNSKLLTPEATEASKVCLTATTNNEFKGQEPTVYRLAASPDPNKRFEGIEMQASGEIPLSRNCGYAGYVPPLENYIKKYTQTAPQYSAADVQLGSRVLQSEDSTPAKEMAVFGPYYSCGIIGNAHCKSTFSDLMSDMAVKTGNIAHPKSFVEFVTDPRYSVAANRMADLIYNKALKVKAGTLKNAGDFYKDLKTAFSSLHLPPAQTEHMIWTFINVLDTQGPSLQYWFHDGYYSEAARPAVVAASIVSSTMSYLDSTSRSSGKMYSIPSSITTHCDYARPYHFWMAASLARELKTQGHSDVDVFSAVHQSESIYEQFGGIGSASATKQDPSISVNGDLHSAYNVETQKNIVYNDYGALWGIKSASNQNQPTLDLDSSILKEYNSAQKPNGSDQNGGFGSVLNIVSKAIDSNVDAKIMFQWKQVIDPDEAYKQLQPFVSK